jgi:hypothetical protein
MKKVILVIFSFVLFPLLGIDVFDPVHGQIQNVSNTPTDSNTNVRTEAKPFTQQLEKAKNEISVFNTDMDDIKRKKEIQNIVELRIEIKTEKDKEILQNIGLECEWSENETVCTATINQMDRLKQSGIEFKVQRQGIRIEKKSSDNSSRSVDKKGVIWGENGANCPIPYIDWDSSMITIMTAPVWATVYTIGRVAHSSAVG